MASSSSPPPTPPPSSSSTQTVQHLTKASSDQLLQKFAELGPDQPCGARPTRLLRGPIIRKKRSKRVMSALGARDIVGTSISEVPSAVRRRASGSRGEWNALLPVTSSKSRSLLFRVGSRRSEPGIASILAALEKTWHRAVQGASRMLVEKHCSTHVRLISDAV